MKILHVSTARTWRGGEQQLAYLLEELRALGLEQWVLCARGSAMESYCRQGGWAFISIKKRFSANPLAGWKILRECKRRSIDIVHAHDSHAHTFAWLAALMGNKTPVVVSRRVDFPIGKSLLSLAKYHHSSVKMILCVSEEIRRVLLSDYRFPERTAVVHSGIDLNKFSYAGAGILRREYAIPDSIPLIANIAAIAPHKDYYTFVDCVDLLVRRGVRAAYFIIGGDGGEKAAIERYIRGKGLEERIHLTGHRSDIPQILREIGLLLFTSKTEGLGTSVLDAMACGAPVVATAAGGIPEMVKDGETGLLAPVGDAESLAAQVERILGDEVLRERLVAGGRRMVESFSKEAMARGVWGWYRSLTPPL